ncbi:MAG: NAD(P)-dependent oxidoreductase [Halohasta sp.]
MKLTVFGANGPTGQRLVDQAVGRGHEVTAVVRSPVPDSRFDDAVTVFQADVYAGDPIESAIEGATAVCSALQHNRLTPSDYVTVTGRHVLDAMAAVGVDRYLTVVPAAVPQEGDRRGLAEAIVAALYRLLRPTVWDDAVTHVEDVADSGLDWTVIRALRLTDGETTRRYRTGDIKLGVGGVSRGDVAAFMLDCCERGIYSRRLPKIRR